MTTATTKQVSFATDFRTESLKPASERKAIVPGRKVDGETIMRAPRRHAITDGRLRQLRKDADKDFPNPYQVGGVYHSVVQSLFNLGPNKAHTFVELKKEMEKIMSKIDRDGQTAWEKFANRKPRNAATGKDLNGRIHQTVTVLQRLKGCHPYGFKLRQVKACLDILKGKDNSALYMLNTSFAKPERVKPRNDMLRQRKPKTAVTQSAGKAKPKAKAKSKPKAKGTAKPKAKSKPKAKAKPKATVKA